MKKITSTMCLLLTLAVLGACSDTEVSTEEIETKGKLKAEDYERLYSDPKKYNGFEVEITGKVFSEPEKDEDGTYIQLWADPINTEKNTLAAINDPKLKIKTDDYVKLKGIVKDEFEGDNAFGGTITAPMILADSIEIVDYITAVAPTLKEVKIDKEINQHGIVVTLQKIEIAKFQTRVYLKVKNSTKDNASFYSSSTKLVLGNKQLEEEYADPETTGLQEIQSELLPSVETEGVIFFPALDPNEKSITLNAEASSDNYDLDFKPFVFEIPLIK